MDRSVILLLALACAPPESSEAVDAVAPGTVVMATASDDYQVGALSLYADGVLTADVATLHGDAVVVVEDDALYVVNRLLMDTVRRYDRADPQLPTWETSLGRGANPHDVARCGGVLWVSRYEETALHLLDPVDGAKLGELDLAEASDADGVPEMSDLEVVDGRLFVGLQRMRRDEGWVAASPGQVAEVDCDARALVELHDVGPNPVLRRAGDQLAVVALDGVWSLDPVSGALDGPWWTGEGVVDLDIGADGRVALVARDGSDHAVGCAEALGGAPAWGTPLASYLPDVLVDDGVAWVAARRGWEDPTLAGALLRFDLDTCSQTERVESTLAPFSLARW
jgi:hypothetical protein